MSEIESKSGQLRTALVTGGSRGIGRAICLELARRGVQVAVNYAGSAQAAEDVAAECTALGASAFAVQCDISDGEAVAAMMKEVLGRFGRLDILVCNAGVTRDNLLMRMGEDEWDAVLNTNLTGAFHCVKAACRPMMKQKYGRIVCVSSIVALRGNAGQVNYAASKAGLIGLVKSVAKELASRNITANAVAPGFVETDMTAALPEAAKAAVLASIPMGRPGAAEDVANAVAFFAGEDAGYITGQVLSVDGGMAV